MRSHTDRNHYTFMDLHTFLDISGRNKHFSSAPRQQISNYFLFYDSRATIAFQLPHDKPSIILKTNTIKHYSSTIIRLITGSMVVSPKISHNKSLWPRYDNSKRRKFHCILRSPQCLHNWPTFSASIAHTPNNSRFRPLAFPEGFVLIARTANAIGTVHREACLRLSWLTVSRTNSSAQCWHYFIVIFFIIITHNISAPTHLEKKLHFHTCAFKTSHFFKLSFLIKTCDTF